MSHDLDQLPADFIAYVKEVQRFAGHERHAARLARALQIRVRMHRYNHAIPEAQPTPLLMVQPWYYGWDNDVLHHEIAHVIMWWSGLEERLLAEYGDEGWSHVERLCQQAVVFLRIPQPVVNAAVARHGVTARAVRAIAHESGADPQVALRRLVYDDPHAARAGFITLSGYATEVALCGARLPFGWLDHVPHARQLLTTLEAPATYSARGRELVGVVA